MGARISLPPLQVLSEKETRCPAVTISCANIRIFRSRPRGSLRAAQERHKVPYSAAVREAAAAYPSILEGGCSISHQGSWKDSSSTGARGEDECPAGSVPLISSPSPPLVYCL